jgi:uncharacterized protein with HEPN domain
MKDDAVYLRHVLDAIGWIQTYVRGLDEEDSKNNHLVQDGVIRQIAIIGEAARQVSLNLQQSNPNIPWSKIVGMRNVLVHDYMGTDVEEVWKTICDDLPVLREQVDSAIQSLHSG